MDMVGKYGCAVLLFTCCMQELRQRLALAGFEEGWADSFQFDEMVDCRDFLLLGAICKGEAGVEAFCEGALDTLEIIRARYQDFGRLEAIGDELMVLRSLVAVSRDFWGRTTGAFFIEARAAFASWRQAA